MEKDKNFKLNAKLDKMVVDGMSRTNEWTELWETSLKYFFGDQIGNKKRHKDWDWIVVNYIWPAAIQEIAKLSKNFPRIIANPWEASDIEAAEVWQSKLQWDWEQGINGTGMKLEQVAAILDGKLFGYRVSKLFWEDKVRWDEEKQEWEGDVKYKLWHPANFWSSDDEKINNGDCGTLRYVSLEWAVNRWPKFKEQLTLEAEEISNNRGQGEPVRGSQSSGSAAALASGVFPGGSESEQDYAHRNLITGLVLSNDKTFGDKMGIAGDEKVVKIEEIYFRDLSTEHIKLEEDISQEELVESGTIFLDEDGEKYLDEAGNEIPLDQWPKRTVKEYDKPRFPTGRFIVRVGKTILNPDEESQAYPHSQWPFVVIPHYLLPHMWRGVNAVEMYRSPQDMINISVTHLFNNMKLFGDPKIAIENDAIAINPRTKKHFSIGAGAGAIIRLARGGLQRMKIIDPPSTSAGASQLYALFTQEFKNITGLQDIASGKKTEGRITATQAQALTISSHDRIALQAVYEDEWIRNLMILDAEISQKNYDVGRYIRIVGDDGIVGAQQISEKLKDVRFDVNVEPAASLPFDEEKRKADYLQAYEVLKDPTPNPLLPDVLRKLGITNWKKIVAQQSSFQNFLQLQQLFDAVKTGEVTIEDAVKKIAQRLTQIAQQEQQGNIIGGQEVPQQAKEQ